MLNVRMYDGYLFNGLVGAFHWLKGDSTIAFEDRPPLSNYYDNFIGKVKPSRNSI